MSPEQERKKAEAEKEALHYLQHGCVDGMKVAKSEPMYAGGLDHMSHGSEMQ